MPEGDTIHNAAAHLTRALVGKTIARFACTAKTLTNASLAGRRVDAVTARGKYLSIHFDDGRVLVTHLRMNGSWHVYREGERWRRPEHLARVVLAVEPANDDPRLIAVCFAAPLVRLVTEREGERDLARLGPDVVAETFDASAAIARLRAAHAAHAIGEAILDQGTLAGVGNIYKSETLFAERIDPFARVADLDDATLARIVARARTLMRRNLGTRPRTTTTGFARARFAVYRRTRRPCPRCGYPIESAKQGVARRTTYYCPRCQAPHVRTARTRA